ncbi:MAG: hypothetical protein LBF67_09705, partial [Prevotellaceae bacterium]|nr:hypothetical protein [Prevotellaceae bacterium]
IKKEKDFDCIKLKNEIQAKIYAEIKDMNTSERIAYFHIPPAQDPFRGKLGSNTINNEQLE